MFWGKLKPLFRNKVHGSDIIPLVAGKSCKKIKITQTFNKNTCITVVL